MATDWVQDVFLPNTTPSDPSQRRLLVLDGHGSYTTTEFMWNCVINNVQLVYLPPHTSHVLEPLDLGVFSSLKSTYRKELSYRAQWGDKTIAGKRQFLELYYIAREKGLSVQNIKSGWQATGLWPISLRKPLLNRLLIPVKETDSQTANQDSQATNQLELTLSEKELAGLVMWLTPRKPNELRDQLISKVFSLQTLQLTIEKNKREFLEKQLEAARPRKKRKVQIDPNERFARIESIHRAQIEAGEMEEDCDKESDSELSTDEEDCIVVNC